MSKYLQLNKSGMSIKEKQELFAILKYMSLNKKNVMNMSIPENCVCGFKDSNCHIYNCNVFSLNLTGV